MTTSVQKVSRRRRKEASQGATLAFSTSFSRIVLYVVSTLLLLAFLVLTLRFANSML
jgi:hypothetical protein